METIMGLVEQAVDFLIERGNVPGGGLIVLGCSSSEIGGSPIGKAGSPETGHAVAAAALRACARGGVALCVQCCEHLNRALVIPADAALRRGYPPVSAVPHPRAGGSCAAAAFRLMPDP
ncbi:MAG: DUF436 domain-containing protein, partial [Firmicutes bacterium]|nr:DUF436 domain-containing protein [Bacillota bacterium]